MKINDLIKNRKSFALIFRVNKQGNSELLAFRFNNSQYKHYRLPGGNIAKREDHFAGVLREIEEETGIKNLLFMRKIGALEYFKPFNNKDVRRIDYLFYCNDRPLRKWAHVDRDNGEIYRYKWLRCDEYYKIDPELLTFVNPYHAPELFIKCHDFGLPRGKLLIKRHNPGWKDFYKHEIYNIMNMIKDPGFAYEHIGSTAVNGLCAKPIVDIGIGINHYKDFIPWIKKMASIGYQYKGENGIPRRHYFVKGDPCFYHVHVFEIRSREWKNHLMFRKILQKDNHLRSAYNTIKQKLVARHVNREDYQKTKGDFINRICNR